MQTSRRLAAGAVTAAILIVVVVVVSIQRGDATDYADAGDMLERLEAAGFEGCRAEDERTIACFDVVGVAYFRGTLTQDVPGDALAAICDPSTITAIYEEGQNWFGRVRAHAETASRFATALDSTARPCPAPTPA